MNIESIANIDKKLLNNFTCGVKDLDTYLLKYALVNDSLGYGKTFLLISNNEIIGYYTLSSSSIKFDEYPKQINEKIPKYPIPCIRIARLAILKKEQGKGYGKKLLKDAFIKILSIADTIGVRLVVVDAKESSKTFYEQYGFNKLKQKESSYFLMIDTLKLAIK